MIFLFPFTFSSIFVVVAFSLSPQPKSCQVQSNAFEILCALCILVGSTFLVTFFSLLSILFLPLSLHSSVFVWVLFQLFYARSNPPIVSICAVSKNWRSGDTCRTVDVSTVLSSKSKTSIGMKLSLAAMQHTECIC